VDMKPRAGLVVVRPQDPRRSFRRHAPGGRYGHPPAARIERCVRAHLISEPNGPSRLSIMNISLVIFSWRSPRLSEDLDFLVARNAADINAIVERAGQRSRRHSARKNPQFAIEIQDRTRQHERMISYDPPCCSWDVSEKGSHQGGVLAREPRVFGAVSGRATLPHPARGDGFHEFLIRCRRRPSKPLIATNLLRSPPAPISSGEISTTYGGSAPQTDDPA